MIIKTIVVKYNIYFTLKNQFIDSNNNDEIVVIFVVILTNETTHY
jgi:hypothetical protein